MVQVKAWNADFTMFGGRLLKKYDSCPQNKVLVNSTNTDRPQNINNTIQQL